MLLQASSLTKFAHIRHAFFTREGGVSQGIYATLNGGVGSSDAPHKVAENRARMAQALGVEAQHLLTPYQIHSPDVVIAEEPWAPEKRPRADAVVTRKPGMAIGVSTADCGPLLFADADARVIGAAHAGWRGAFTGIIEATLTAMEKLGADRSRITVALGPTIRQPNYEVGPEFVERFTQEIPGYMQKHLVKAGITGWAQVNDLRGDSDLTQRIQYDLYYIDNWSVWFDLRILVLTLWHTLTSHNAR
jgi:hypothetical protein